jgi:hypothetical protein
MLEIPAFWPRAGEGRFLTRDRKRVRPEFLSPEASLVERRPGRATPAVAGDVAAEDLLRPGDEAMIAAALAGAQAAGVSETQIPRLVAEEELELRDGSPRRSSAPAWAIWLELVRPARSAGEGRFTAAVSLTHSDRELRRLSGLASHRSPRGSRA